MSVGLAAGGRAVAIAVADSGPGFRDLGRAFDRGWRGGWRRGQAAGAGPGAGGGDEVPGSGLGLPIARDLARAMGGDVVAANNGPPGAGATVTLTVRRA